MNYNASLLVPLACVLGVLLAAELGLRAKAASRELARASSADKDAALLAACDDPLNAGLEIFAQPPAHLFPSAHQLLQIGCALLKSSLHLELPLA